MIPNTPVGFEALERRVLLSMQSPDNVQITSDPGVQQMPSIAADPLDPNHLVIAYMDYSLVSTGYAGIAVAVSTDGGGNWQHTSVQLPAGFDQGAADPVVKFDGRGHVFVSYMAATFLGQSPPLTDPPELDPVANTSPRAHGFESNSGIFVARSDDGGANWAPPVAVSSHTYAGQDVAFELSPDLAVDTFSRLPDGSPNPRYGSLYAVWTRLYPPGQFPGHPDSTGGGDAMIAVSRDAGRTWQLQLRPDPAAGVPVTTIRDPGLTLDYTYPPGNTALDKGRLSIGPEGDVYASDFTAGDFSIFHSADGGATFDGPNHVDGAWAAFGLGFQSIPASTDGLPTNHFRTPVVRQIAANPAQPGTVYAAEAIFTSDPASNRGLDPADVYFARSEDYGKSWTPFSYARPNPAAVINDDNDGRPFSALNPDTVVSGQALPRLAVDDGGNPVVIWYDTRRDPGGHLLDVFGTVSDDGGRTFSPNFRVTDQSFDADAGRFTDAAGMSDYDLGSLIGLTVAGDTVYAAWTDTRRGNQDVSFARFPTRPPPAAPNDRFEPNDTAAAATDLGELFQRHLPNLSIPAGDDDWFRLQAAADGIVSATAAGVRLELWDGGGTTLLAHGSDVGGGDNLAGQQVVFPARAGEHFLVHVSSPGSAGSAAGGAPRRYALDLSSLTAEPDHGVAGTHEGTLPAGGQAYFLLTAAAAGSMDVSLTAGGGSRGSFALELLDFDPLKAPGDLTTLATGQASGAPGPGQVVRASLTVYEGQSLLVHVSGGGPAAGGDFRLEFANLDQFATGRNGAALLPDPAGPSKIASADFNGDGIVDLVVTNTLSNTVSLFLGNENGYFQAPRQFDVGAFSPSVRGLFVQALPSFGRGLAVADVNRDGRPDLVVTNYSSADVSVLLGRGDGTFDPQRRFDATPGPLNVEVGDFDGDGLPDLAVVGTTAAPAAPGADPLETLAVLFGRGDGTFRPQKLTRFPAASGFPPGAMKAADFNRDGLTDLAISVLNDTKVHVLLSRGDGTFDATDLADETFNTAMTISDVDGDGNADILTGNILSTARLFSGRGDGSFESAAPTSPAGTGDSSALFVGQVPIALALEDIGSPIERADGTKALGPPDGHADLVAANSGISLGRESVGPPEVVVLPALTDAAGHFRGFGAPVQLGLADGPLDLAVADFNLDGVPDAAAVDGAGIRLFYGPAPGDGTGAEGKPPGPVIPPNDSPQTARDQGVAVHTVQPTLTITPGREDAYYAATSPTEAARGAEDDVIDFSAFFQATDGAGLGMEVLDPATGRVLGSGEHVRLRIGPGRPMLIHVFGATAPDGTRGTGAYTLDIDVLPQVVSVQAQSPIPAAGGGVAGPSTSLVLTFQGDRLDPAAAQDPANYRVLWLGKDGRVGTGDDRVIPLANSAGDASNIVYNPGADVDVASGLDYPTAVRQTVTLLFDRPLPSGSYRVELAPAIGSELLGQDERDLLARSPEPYPHSVVTLSGGQVTPGGAFLAGRLVSPVTSAPDFAQWAAGTPFLTQLHDDLGAVLDATLTQGGDQPAITPALLDQITRRFRPALSAAGPTAQSAAAAVLVVFLDPVPFGLADPSSRRVIYDPDGQTVTSGISDAFVNVTGNMEVVTVPISKAALAGDSPYVLTVGSVQGTSRGGAVVLDAAGNARPTGLTDALRAGERSFTFYLGAAVDLIGRAIDVWFASGSAQSTLLNLVPLPVTGILQPAAAPPAPTISPSAQPLEPLTPFKMTTLSSDQFDLQPLLRLLGQILRLTLTTFDWFFGALGPLVVVDLAPARGEVVPAPLAAGPHPTNDPASAPEPASAPGDGEEMSDEGNRRDGTETAPAGQAISDSVPPTPWHIAAALTPHDSDGPAATPSDVVAAGSDGARGDSGPITTAGFLLASSAGGPVHRAAASTRGGRWVWAMLRRRRQNARRGC